MLECSRGIDELAQWSLLQLSYEWSLLGQGSDTSNTNIMNSAITLNGSPSVKTITPTRPRCRRQASSRSGLYRHGCLDANLHPRSRQLRRSGTYATFTNGLISAATRIPHSSYRQRSIQLAHHSYRTKSNRIHERSLHWTNRNLHQPHISHTK